MDEPGGRRSDRTSWIVAAGVTAALLVATGVVAVVGQDGGAPDEASEAGTAPADRRDVPTAPVSVSLHGPLGAGAVVGVPVAVTAQLVASSPITTVQLWDGARLVEERALATVTDHTVASWHWVPEEGGSRVLLARAVTEAGAVGQSSPLWVTVRESDHPALPSWAGEPGSVAAPIGFRSREAGRASRRIETALAPTVAVDGCTATATLPAGTDTLYVAPAGATTFLPAVQAPAGGAVSFGVVGGTQLAYAGSVDGAMSEPAELVVPEDCSADLWSGDARIVGGRLSASANADRAYVYLSVDGGPWRRVPSAPQTFVARGADGTYDFSGVLPPLAGASLELRAYGRLGPDLVSMGQGTLGFQLLSGGSGAYQLGLLDAVMAGSGLTELDWIATHGSAGTPEIDQPEVLLREGTVSFVDGTLVENGAPAELDFRWSTNSQAATHGIWQLSTLPPPSSPDLDFPGLLAYQAIPGPTGEFTVDLDAAVKGQGPQNTKLIETVSWSDVSPDALGLVLDTSGIVVPGGSTTQPPASGDSMGLPLFLLPLLSELVQPTMLWVRVVPMAGTQPLPNVSNRVLFTVGDAPPPILFDPQPGGFESPKIASTKVTFYPPHQANPEFQRCVRVVANPQGSLNFGIHNGFPVSGDPAPVGETLCATYNPPESSWFDYLVAAVEFVTEVWDEVVTFVNELKSDLVSFIADLGCSQLLDGAGVDDAKGACETMITTAVDTYLAANGIPPTLPTSSAVKEGLKGDLAAVAAEAAAENCPVVAQSACKDEAEKIADELLDRIEQQVSDSVKSAANSGDWDLFIADYIEVVPEPAGLPGPAMFAVTVQLATPPLTDTYCSVTPQVVGTHPSWQYATKNGTIVTKPITGSLYPQHSGAVTIEAGASTATGVVALNDLDTTWVPPDGSVMQTKAKSQSWPFNAWFRPEATLTMRLTGCGLDSSSAPTMTVQGGLPYPKVPEDVVLP